MTRAELYGEDDTPWQAHAVCSTVDPELFFPENGPQMYAVARRICAVCPVRLTCLTEGLHEEFGMWGGLTPDERHALRNNVKTSPRARTALLQAAARVTP